MRAVMPVTGDRAADQARMPGAQLVSGEAKPGRRAGGEILHEHIRPGQQGRHDVMAALALHVELDGFLPAVQPDEVTRLAEHGAVVVAGEVTAARPLYFDDP